MITRTGWPVSVRYVWDLFQRGVDRLSLLSSDLALEVRSPRLAWYPVDRVTLFQQAMGDRVLVGLELWRLV